MLREAAAFAACCGRRCYFSGKVHTALITLHTLASGSEGNSLLVSADGTHLLVDAGISARRIKQSLALLGLTPDDLSAILISHEHTDHTAGLATLLKHHPIPLYATGGTAFYLRPRLPQLDSCLHLVSPDSSFSVGPAQVTVFATSHDAGESVDYRVDCGDAAVGILTAAALLIAGISIYSSRQETRVLNVYNWGEYISDGSDDSLDTIAAFEDWYKATYGVPVKVNYDTYASNEDMYAKLKSGAVSYDVVIPSDYMIARMEAEDMLLPLNYDNIPNYQYISEDFRGLYYDPDDTYTVPYTYGIVGVIYNANVVDEADTGGWDLMWNPKYAGNILQFNNARDALGTAMYRAGIDVNTTDHADWQQALQALVDQRPLVKSYVMDEIYNMMESGEAAVAAYYAGDYFTMCDAQADSVDLQFYYPENTNYFIDAMCIPTSCRDQELAECFINFMLSREAAVANAEYIYYASPNRLVYDDPEYIDDMGEDTMDILYPGIGSFRDEYNRSAYRNLDQDTLTYVNSLWETLKIN